jgi:hypothetical protein
MERVSGQLSDYISSHSTPAQLDKVVDELDRFLKVMCKYKLVHGDLHLFNIAYILDPASNYKLKIVPIDFGWARKGECDPELELLQIMRGCFLSIWKYKPPTGLSKQEEKYAVDSYAKNVNYIEKKVYNTLFKGKYGFKTRNTYEAINRRYNNIYDEKGGHADKHKEFVQSFKK